MIIIAPAKPFLLEHRINNPSDSNTYYVKAVIKNSLTGAILDTVILTDNGSKYFSKIWNAPADPTGTGFQLSIFTTVYDDSGYSTESAAYGTTLERMIVRDLEPRGGGGGFGIDPQAVVEIIRKEIAKIQFPEVKIPEQREVSLDTIEGQLADLSELLRAGEGEKGIIKKLKDRVFGQQDTIETAVRGIHSIISEIQGVKQTLSLIERTIDMQGEKHGEYMRSEINRLEQTMKSLLSSYLTIVESKISNLSKDLITKVSGDRMKNQELRKLFKQAGSLLSGEGRIEEGNEVEPVKKFMGL